MIINILTQEKYSKTKWFEDFRRALLHDAHMVKYVYDHTDHMNCDLVISLLYDKIVKNNEFDIPRLGTINIHPSLLPEHRGSCPNFWAVLSGDGAGWTAHRMTAEIDRGSIYLQRPVYVRLSDTAETLWHRLFDKLPSFLFELTKLISAGNLEPLQIKQDNEGVNTLKEFHRVHNAHELLKSIVIEQKQLDYFSPGEIMYATLNMIQACSFGDYPGFYLDTPDGRVEFRATRIDMETENV